MKSTAKNARPRHVQQQRTARKLLHEQRRTGDTPKWSLRSEASNIVYDVTDEAGLPDDERKE